MCVLGFRRAGAWEAAGGDDVGKQGESKRLLGIEGVLGSGCNIVDGRAYVPGGEGVTVDHFRTTNSNSNNILNIYIRLLL